LALVPGAAPQYGLIENPSIETLDFDTPRYYVRFHSGIGVLSSPQLNAAAEVAMTGSSVIE
jgi:hypothetical protein